MLFCCRPVCAFISDALPTKQNRFFLKPPTSLQKCFGFETLACLITHTHTHIKHIYYTHARNSSASHGPFLHAMIGNMRLIAPFSNGHRSTGPPKAINPMSSFLGCNGSCQCHTCLQRRACVCLYLFLCVEYFSYGLKDCQIGQANKQPEGKRETVQIRKHAVRSEGV